MTSSIVYRTKEVTSLLLTIDPGTEFRRIVDDFEEIHYPPLRVNPELVSFALLELVSNSIRAHREKGITDAVLVQIAAEGGELRARVQDSGRGFDPSLLPYDIDAAPENVDLMSDAFAEYRRRHDGSRFGMGLYVAKKTFRKFQLAFVDAGDRPCPWFSGKVKGTRIDMTLPLARPEDDAAADVEEISSFEEAVQ